MIELPLGAFLALLLAGNTISAVTAAWWERRKNRARNAAYAECVECPHKSAPDALAAAHSAALAHRSTTGHHVMIVKA